MLLTSITTITIMKKAILSTILATAALTATAQNPYLPLWEFIPDGEPYVFDDPDHPGKKRVYIYGSHDVLREYYCGRDQVVWSAPVDDLTQWRFDGVIFRLTHDRDGNLINKDGDVLYAPDVCETRDDSGRRVYYLYPNVQSDERGSAVARSYRPDGPFEVCNWSSDNPRRTVGPIAFDPAAFVDDDGRAYAYWGFGRSMACELDPATMATPKPGTSIVEDMITGFQDSVTFNKIYRFFEASSIRKIKDKYVFIYSRFTNEGEDGLPMSNYTLAYCYSNSPLGPWTYGGTLIDGRGKEHRPDGTTVATACPYGNTHGSICEINGKWWLFYHRQCGTTEYNRQAVVAPINVEVMEGQNGYVRISEAEFTSEGFKTEGLDPYQEYQAGIACYFTGPEGARQEYPYVHYSGSHSEVNYVFSKKEQVINQKWQSPANYPYEKIKSLPDPYDKKYSLCPMVNNTPGSVFGYKYYNFSLTYGKKNLSLLLDIVPEHGGTIDVFLDRPSEQEGGVLLASATVKSGAKPHTLTLATDRLQHYNGKHALFLRFRDGEKGKSVCRVNTLCFK